eukprot:scpid91827/ scgid11598/ 
MDLVLVALFAVTGLLMGANVLALILNYVRQRRMNRESSDLPVYATGRTGTNWATCRPTVVTVTASSSKITTCESTKGAVTKLTTHGHSYGPGSVEGARFYLVTTVGEQESKNGGEPSEQAEYATPTCHASKQEGWVPKERTCIDQRNKCRDSMGPVATCEDCLTVNAAYETRPSLNVPDQDLYVEIR